MLMEKLKRGKVAHGLVRAQGVVGPLPNPEVPVLGGYIQVIVVELIKLLSVGPLGPLYAPIELGRSGRQYKQGYPSASAFLLEVGLELRPPAHLDSPDGERGPLLEGVQEHGCGSGCSPGVDLYYIPAADHVSGGEVLQYHSGQWPYIQGVYLHQVPRLLCLIPLGPPHSIGTAP